MQKLDIKMDSIIKRILAELYHVFHYMYIELTEIREATKMICNKLHKTNHVKIVLNTFNSATRSKKISNNAFNRNSLGKHLNYAFNNNTLKLI